MILQVAVAMLATLTFSIMFGAPRRHWFFCALIGGIAWFARIVFLQLGTGSVVAAFLATLTLTFFSRLFSYWQRSPVTLFLLPGIFPLVPGAGIYYTANYLFASDFAAGVSKGVETLKFAGAITLGILIGVSIPPQVFRFLSKNAR